MKRFELAVDTSAATAHADMARRIIATKASCNWLLGMVSPKMASWVNVSDANQFVEYVSKLKLKCIWKTLFRGSSSVRLETTNFFLSDKSASSRLRDTFLASRACDLVNR